MPGFKVSGVGRGANGQPKAYYSYSWYIQNLFGSSVGRDGSSALVYLKDMTLPSITISPEQYQGSALEYKFAKSVNWDDVKVTWYDTEGLLPIMKQWRQSVWTPESGLKPACEYKKQSALCTELPEGGGTNTWTLINSWPSTIKYGELTYTQSDVKVVDATVTYDWAEEG